MKRIIKEAAGCLALAAVMGACMGNKKNQAEARDASADTLWMVVGSYADAEAEGIKVFRFNQETGEASYQSGLRGVANPSFLHPSADGARVYAVSEGEADNSMAVALSFDKATGRLDKLNEQLAHGAAPCYINLSPNGSYAVTANYNGASITVFPVDSAGALQPGEAIGFQGKGLDRERQECPHLHCVYFTPDHRFLLANDLGADCIHVFPLQGEELRLDRQRASEVSLTPGSGPRHACFNASGNKLYLLDELMGDVKVLSYDGGTFRVIQTVQADTVAAKGSADIHLSPDGRFLYASNRLKADGIAIFKVDEANGTLIKVGYQLTGRHPRNFAITPNGRFLVVACRDTNEMEVYSRNSETGLLEDLHRPIPMERPVCVRWIERSANPE